MATLYLCLGADAGNRVETLIRAARTLAARLGASAATASSLYADRHGQAIAGASVNLLLRLHGVLADEAAVQAILSSTEELFGRERDPERQLPVALDVDWIATARHGVVQWNARYDHGRAYVWLGLHELDDAALASALARVAAERDFDATSVRRAFYPLISTGFVNALLRTDRALIEEPLAAEPA